MTLTQDQFRQIVERANLAPSIHNAQPSRWRRSGAHIDVSADLGIRLPHADPDGDSIALSLGAAVEGTVLALSEAGYAAQVTDLWDQERGQDWDGHRIAGRITLAGGEADPLAAQLPNRGTWRGAFQPEAPDLYGWTRADTRLIFDTSTKPMIAALNDEASLKILRNPAFRTELLSWMRLKDSHPRAGRDGMDLNALRMDTRAAKTVRLGFGPLWRIMDALGRAKVMVSEDEVTQNTPLIAALHRPKGESPIATGRAYLRMWLEATQLGFAGWPMAALTDDAETREQLEHHLGVDPDHRLIQVIRFGKPTGPMPRRARRPLAELIPNEGGQPNPVALEPAP